MKTHTMFNLNKHTKTKSNLNQKANLRTVHACAYHCVQLLHTTHTQIVVMIFPPNQTIITVPMLLTAGRGQQMNSAHYPNTVGWLRGSVVERRSSAGVLSLSCARPVADG